MGGKRKKSNNGPIKKESKYKIPSRFDCPVCDSKSSIAVKIFRKEEKAKVFCTRCGIGSEETMPVKPLEKNVDVFFKFHEALLAMDREGQGHRGTGSSSLVPVAVNGFAAAGGAAAAAGGGLSALSAATAEFPDAVHFAEPVLDEEEEEDPFR